METKAEEIRRSVEQECARAKLSAEVRLDGSVAKDTWIRDYVDVDIFMRVSPDLTKKQLEEICLPIAKRALHPSKVAERFAEHPYVESMVELANGSLRVNVVPCYRVERGAWISATDRSPFHTEYVRAHLTSEQRDEVRLLKAFMRGIGAYGADIKTGGFSGMICETLIITRKGFLNVLNDFTNWREERFIDVEGYYEGRGEEVRRMFIEPLRVIDPVDKGRNLGAAVRPTQLWNFVSAARRFLEKPSPSFFTEKAIKPLTQRGFQKTIRNRGSTILCIVTGRVDAVVDILWSQLYRTQRALANFLVSNDFELVRSAAWSDEKSMSVLLFELESGKLPNSKRHRGPPVSKQQESLSFLSKHLGQDRTMSGPWIEGDRWLVQRARMSVSAQDLLRSILKTGGGNVGVAPLLVKAFRKDAKLIEGNEVGRLVRSNGEFGKFMRTYLVGRPTWLA